MPDLTVAEYLTRAIESSGKTQVQIARETGFPKPNIITMFKQGQTKVPINRAPAIARAIGCDPRQFLKLVLSEYQPEIIQTLEEELGVSWASSRPYGQAASTI